MYLSTLEHKNKQAAQGLSLYFYYFTPPTTKPGEPTTEPEALF
jgi:hypothetical protein